MKTKASSGSRVTNRLVALSSAAVLTVYSAGYLRTRTAADKLSAAERPRVVIPAPRGEQPLDPARGAAATQHDEPREIPERTATVAHAAAPVVSTNVPKPESAPVASPVVEPAAAVATPMPAPTTTAVASLTEPGPTPTPTPSPTPATPLYKDGTFSGWGTSRHGDIEATVVIESGKITSAVISQCWTRYSCSWVAHLQGQVVTRQSAEVDYVTGATQSANAFYYAVVQALSKAK